MFIVTTDYFRERSHAKLRAPTLAHTGSAFRSFRPCALAAQMDGIELTEGPKAKARHPSLFEPRTWTFRAPSVVQGCSMLALWVMAILCLILGIAVIAVPASWSSLHVGGADVTVNRTCPAVTPETTPYAPTDDSSTKRHAFIAAWENYVSEVAGRSEGVRPGCMPMRFPATSTYRGAVIVHHGFSSCPQEMATLGPPLAAAGYDVLFTLLPGHGNAIKYSPDAPNFLWAFLGIAFSLMGLLAMCCVRFLPCAKLCEPCLDCCVHGGCCDHRRRTACITMTAILLGILLIVSIVGAVIVVAGGDDVCISLSYTDGVGPGCDGMSEYNDNMPSSGSGYTDWLDAFDRDVVSLAPGTVALAGLSGGGGAALHSSMATRADGSALYTRTALFAPYIDVATIGGALTPAIALGLGEVKVDFGNECRVVRRGAGKAGYCNYRLSRIAAMREVAQKAMEDLKVPRGGSVEIVKVKGDPTVTNDDITKLYEQLRGLTPNASMCVANHVDSMHSPCAAAALQPTASSPRARLLCLS